MRHPVRKYCTGDGIEGSVCLLSYEDLRRDLERNGRIECHRGVNGEEVRDQASNMRRCHGGARERGNCRSRTSIGGKNVETGSEDIDACAPVGEVSALITKGGSSNSDCVFRCRGRIVTSVLVVIA